MIRLGLIEKGGELLASCEFKMNSPKLLSLVSDADSAGPHWADRWLTGLLAGPRGKERREGLAGSV
jgi:hypothetical protein